MLRFAPHARDRTRRDAGTSPRSAVFRKESTCRSVAASGRPPRPPHPRSLSAPRQRPRRRRLNPVSQPSRQNRKFLSHPSHLLVLPPSLPSLARIRASSLNAGTVRAPALSRVGISRQLARDNFEVRNGTPARYSVDRDILE